MQRNPIEPIISLIDFASVASRQQNSFAKAAVFQAVEMLLDEEAAKQVMELEVEMSRFKEKLDAKPY